MSLSCRTTSSTDEFLAHVLPFLVSRPVECSFLLTDSARAAGRGEPGPLRPGQSSEQAWAWVEDSAVRDGGGAVAAVCGAGPRGGWLSPGPAEAGRLLAGSLRAANVSLDVVNGPPDILDAFVSAWCDGRALRTAPGMPLGVYVAGLVVPPDGVAGRMRRAAPEDAALLGAWGAAFAREVDGVRITPDVVAGRIAAGQVVVVWEVDGDVVSMAAAAPHPGDVSRVYLVYTPPRLRGRGYASACVATLTAREVAAPGHRCMLFTDLANPATNRIYQAIGYDRVGILASLRVEPGPTG